MGENGTELGEGSSIQNLHKKEAGISVRASFLNEFFYHGDMGNTCVHKFT